MCKDFQDDEPIVDNHREYKGPLFLRLHFADTDGVKPYQKSLACPGCAAQRHVALGSGPMAIPPGTLFNGIHNPGEERTLLLCRVCLLVFISPRPTTEELSTYYSTQFNKNIEAYLGHKGINHEGQAHTEQRRFSRFYAEVAPKLPKSIASVLDVGGGNGSSLAPFAEKGMEVSVIDPSPSNQTPHCNRYESLEEVKRAGHTPSLILSLHTLEHIGEVGNFLSSLAEISARGTYWILEVPADLLYLKFTSWGKFLTLTHPEHINLCFPDSMIRLLRLYGVETIKAEVVVADHFTGPVISFRMIGIYTGNRVRPVSHYSMLYFWFRILIWRLRARRVFRAHRKENPSASVEGLKAA